MISCVLNPAGTGLFNSSLTAYAADVLPALVSSHVVSEIEPLTRSALSILGFSIAGFSIAGLSMRGFSIAGLMMPGFAAATLSIRGFSIAGLSIRGFSIAGLATPLLITGLKTSALRMSVFSIAG